MTRRPFTQVLLALGFAGLFAASAAAQLPTTYSPGDFLVGFRQVGNNNSVVVDIGPITSFSNPISIAINLGSTLQAQYGAGWASDPNVFFSLVETSATNNTSLVTSPQYLTGPNAGPARVWSRLTNTVSTTFQNKINNLGNEFTSRGVVQPKTDANAYANFMPGGSTDAGHANGNIAWGYFNPTTEGNFGETTAGVVLDLIQLAPGTGLGTEVGTFQLSANGNTLSFSAVPEPSTLAVLGLGALALAGFQLRKTRQAVSGKQAA